MQRELRWHGEQFDEMRESGENILDGLGSLARRVAILADAESPSQVFLIMRLLVVFLFLFWVVVKMYVF